MLLASRTTCSDPCATAPLTIAVALHRAVTEPSLQAIRTVTRITARPELICGSAPNEGSIALNGRRALTFSGPGARDTAERHRAERDADDGHRGLEELQVRRLEVAAVVAIIIELGGGLMLIAGWKARWAAAAMFLFTAVAAIIFHNFWAVPADAAQNQTIHFMKNISMLGGLLYVVVYGSGPLSVESSGEK